MKVSNLRKGLFELIVLITCGSVLAFLFLEYRTGLKEQEKFEILKAKLVAELTNNYRAIVLFEVDQWQPLIKMMKPKDQTTYSDGSHITKEKFESLNREIHSLVSVAEVETDAWEVFKITSQINSLNFRTIRRLNECYTYFEDRDRFLSKYQEHASKITLSDNRTIIDEGNPTAKYLLLLTSPYI